MKQNIAINFFSFVRREREVDEDTGLPAVHVTEGDFVLEEGLGIFSGFQTNEAPLANMTDLLARDGEKLARIYCLATPQCLSPEMGGEDTGLVSIEDGVRSVYASQFDFWCARMRRLRPALAEAAIIAIPLRYREDALIEDIEGQVAALTERIKGDAGGASAWRDCHIYADITGGPRYVNMMMTSVLQFLQYDGMQVEKMLYADFHTLSRENRVFDVRAAGDAYKLVAGADAFVSLGSSRAIEEYFAYDAQTGAAGRAVGSELRGVLAAMHAFSDAIQICQTGSIPRALSALSASLEQFLDLPEEERSVDDRMFMQLIDTITEGYGVLLEEMDDESDRYPSIIRWCMEKGLLQQAMTLATEWLPVCFVRRRIVYPAEKFITCAEAAVDRMHPGWMQNFIINPYVYWSKIQETCLAEYRPMLSDALERGIVPQDAPPLIASVAGVNRSFDRLRRETNDLRTLPEDVREIYEHVCMELEKGNSGQMWTVRGLLSNKGAWKHIKDQILKKKNNPLTYRLLGIKQCVFRQGDPDDAEARWAAWSDTWTKMTDEMGIVQTEHSRDDMMSCLRTYFYLREQRNQVNHAVAGKVLLRREIETILNDVLAALSAATSGRDKKEG